ncbi:MAG: S8/S53 family peptidase [Myxococcota bacterium]
MDATPTRQAPDVAQQPQPDPDEALHEQVQADVDRRCPQHNIKNLVKNAGGCPLGIWVGEARGATCPPPGKGWTARPVLGDDDAAADAPLSASAPFCAYAWTGEGTADPCELPSQPAPPPGPVGTPTEPAVPPGEWLDRDCRVVAPVGGLEPVLADYASGRLAQVMQGLEVPPTKVASLLASGIGVTETVVGRPVVAILDTAPAATQDEQLGNLPDSTFHGLAVHGLARAVACQSDAAACLADFIRIQALTEDSGSGNAGAVAFAYQATGLTRAIRKATELWRELKLASDDTRPGMIVNLSVGWDPSYTLSDDPNAPAGTERASARAVRVALREAACAGLLIFAAAGNPPSGSAPATGPVYPAAWETTMAPTEGQCACFRECNSPAGCLKCGGPAPAAEPLLYAVGAIDDADNELVGAREKGMPRLAAPGYLVASPLPDSTTFAITRGDALRLPVMTGTSMSTAIVSGIAAAVWRTNPNLSRSEVVATMRDNSEPLAVNADFCGRSATSCPAAGRVSYCRAVAAAGEFAAAPEDTPAGKAKREFVAECVTAKRPAGSAPVASAWTDAMREELADVEGSESRAYVPTSAPRPSLGGRVVEDALTRPWIIAPQPSRDPCSACEINTMHNSLTMFTANWLTSATNLRDTLLTVTYLRGATLSYSLEASVRSPLVGSRTYSVTGLGLGTGATGATLSWLGTENGQTVSFTSQIGVSNGP